MTVRRVVVVDYGMSNTLSVSRALEYCGAAVDISDAVAAVKRADSLVLPGVGAFGKGMENLTRGGVADAVRRFVESERPFLGVCLGMHMMFERSGEGDAQPGLGILSGRVERLPALRRDGTLNKVPHIAWSPLVASAESRADQTDPLLAGIAPGAHAYFAHSYAAKPSGENQVVAQTAFGDGTIAAAVRARNASGVQFHPEKSGSVGLAILNNFLSQ